MKSSVVHPMSMTLVLCAGVLPELRRFFTSRSCCAFFPAPAGKLDWLILRLWSYGRKICNTIGHILDIVCCNMIMFCKIVTKYLFLLANFGPWSETVLFLLTVSKHNSEFSDEPSRIDKILSLTRRKSSINAIWDLHAKLCLGGI
jgi:hypothetical protein